MKLSKVGIIAVVLIACIAIPVSASTPLTITTANLWELNSYPGYAYHNGGYLLWSFGQSLTATNMRACGDDIQFADNYGYYWGECVSAVKALSGSTVGTASWIQGSQVTSGGVSQGTAIATFPGGSYSGHAAIFKGYTYSGSTITGVQVWDQNWTLDGSTLHLFGTHTLYRSGSGVNNADNYYVVRV